MNPDVFFKNFELLADAPSGVQKLRELILQLAVMGKLVEQDPNDESASIFSKITDEENGQFTTGGKTKKSSKISREEIPYELPNTWKWMRLSDVSHDWGQKKPDVKFTYIDVTSINKELGLISEDLKLLDPEDAPSRARKIVKKGTVIYSTVRPYLLNIAIVDKNFDPEPIVSTAFAILHPYSGILNTYLYYYLRSKPFISYVESEMTGMAYPAINDTKLYKGLIPLPPLAEQKRIVSKVDELMALCDKLEARRQKKQEIQSKLNSAALDKMLSAENQAEFEQYWQRICENFDILYDNPENIEKLKKAILQLAVQGKLVEQDLEDEPASVLIEKIMAEKKNLVKVGKIKGTKSVSLETTDNIPILPEKWELVNLDSIILFMDAGWSPACKNHPTEDEQTWGVLKTTSVQPLMFLWAEHKELPENLTPRPGYEVKAGDILITRAGPKNRVGICCLVKDTRPHLMISDKIIRFHLLDEFVFPEFVTLCLNTGFSQSFIESQKSGMAESQMNISQNKLRMTQIPLPPLNEQKRIVEKVEQLMGLCDELELKLRKSREDRGKLMETVVRGLLEGATAEI